MLRWSLGMDIWSNLTLCQACDYLSMLGYKLNRVRKRGPSWAFRHHFSVDVVCPSLLLFRHGKVCHLHITYMIWLRSSQLSQLSFMMFMGLCIFSLPTSLMMIVRICVVYCITIMKSEVWTICHCLGLGHETIVFAACLYIFIHTHTYIYIYII